MFDHNILYTSVNKYSVNDEALIVWHANNIIRECPVREELYKGDIINYHIKDDCLLISCDFKGNKIIIQNNRRHDFTSGRDGVIEIINYNSFLRICHSEDYLTSFLSRYGLEQEKDIWKREIKTSDKIISIGNQIFIGDGGHVFSIDLELGTTLWQQDLGIYLNDRSKPNNLLKIEKFIGTFRELLILAYSDGSVVSINKESGEFVNKWFSNSGMNKQSTRKSEEISNPGIYVLSMCIDEEFSRVVGISGSLIWYIDLDSNEVHYINLYDELQRHDLAGIKRVTGFAIIQTHYFISAESEYYEDLDRRKDSLVAINKNDFKFDWKYLFESEWLATHTAQFGNNTLYQLDNDCILHVFNCNNHYLI